MKQFKIIQKGINMKKLILPISTLLLIAVGCDNPIRDKAVELDSAELQSLSYELASDLGLSQTSAKEVNGVLNKHGRGGKHREPGFLWNVAGELAVKLSDEKKARLFEKMDEHNIQVFGGKNGQMGQGHGGKHGGGMMGGRRGGGGMGQGHGGNGSGGGLYSILTDEQKEAFKEIAESYKDQFQAIQAQVKEGTINQDDARSQMEGLREAMHAEIDALLTDEQKAELEEMKADHEAEMQAFQDSSKAVMVEVLGLTAEQLTAFDQIKDDTKTAMEALREQLSNGDIDLDAFREAATVLHGDASSKLEALFTDEQIEIFKIHKALKLRMKKHHGSKGKKGRGHKSNGGNRGNNK